jgi:hypothetical protein
MAETALTTPYATAIPFLVTAIPTWLDEYNAQRLASYDLYDDMYNNRPDTSLMLRGSDEKPIYVPTAKRVVNTLCRYVGKDWGYELVPETGTPADQEAAKTAFSALFVRESILSQFSVGKAEWMRRGDWMWMLVGDPDKPAGSRISVKTIDPRTYFPLNNDPEDVDRLTGQQVVEEHFLDDGTTLALKVQTWYKYTDPEHSQFGATVIPDGGIPIEYKCEILDMKDWQDDVKRNVLSTVVPLGPIEGTTGVISQLPIYHIKNNGTSSDPFGMSILAGLESVVAGISQAISDEDLALAMAGLGMYVTDSGAPVDADDGSTPVNWLLGPQQVIEVAAGRSFKRLAGITSVDPVQKHVDYLEEQAYGSAGINDIALGTRGAVTESGVALAIRMQPLFDEADNDDLQINDIMSQMFHDLATMWFPAFEQISFGDVQIVSGTSKDRLPFDRAEFWAELSSGYEMGILPLSYVHRQLNEKLGFELSDQDLKDALAEAATKAAQADPYGARTDAELNGAASGDENTPTDGVVSATSDAAAAA